MQDTRKLLQGCESNGDGTAWCSYKLGYYKDYIERGLGQPW